MVKLLLLKFLFIALLYKSHHLHHIFAPQSGQNLSLGVIEAPHLEQNPSPDFLTISAPQSGQNLSLEVTEAPHLEQDSEEVEDDFLFFGELLFPPEKAKIPIITKLATGTNVKRPHQAGFPLFSDIAAQITTEATTFKKGRKNIINQINDFPAILTAK